MRPDSGISEVLNIGTLAETLPAPAIAMAARAIEHLSSTVAVSLPAPAVIVQAMSTELAAAAVAVILPAPAVSSMVVEVEHVGGAIAVALPAPLTVAAGSVVELVTGSLAIVLPAPLAAGTAVEVEHLSGTARATLQAPQSRSMAVIRPADWRINWAAARAASPRLYKRHLRYREIDRVRYGGQLQSFIAQQARRMNMSHAQAFHILSRYSAEQLQDAETMYDLPT